MSIMDVFRILFDMGCPVNGNNARSVAVSQRVGLNAFRHLLRGVVLSGELFDI